MSEIQLQADCFQWAWMTHQETRRHLWSVPNGGSRNGFEATQLKASGVIAGIHDLHFFWKSQFYTFELKVDNNQLTADHVDKKGRVVFGQKEWGAKMIKHGAICFEIRNFEDFKEAFESIIAGVSLRSILENFKRLIIKFL